MGAIVVTVGFVVSFVDGDAASGGASSVSDGVFRALGGAKVRSGTAILRAPRLKSRSDGGDSPTDVVDVKCNEAL